MSLFWMVILFMIFQPSYQKKYLCNPNLECGCSMKPASLARIVGGEEAGQATWGWAVSLFIGDDQGKYLCGGSIISSSWIITAAHCLEGIAPSNIIVYAGSNTRWVGTQNRTVSRIIVHSDFNSDDLVNDIGLLQLTYPLNMEDPAVSSICLPSISSKTLAAGEWPVPGTAVVTIGWGLLTEKGVVPKNLQQVTLETIDYQASTCEKLIVDKQVQLCASVPNGDKDACQGDSGGPLMIFTSENQWVLVGLTSFGEGCAQKSFSGIYTRVAAFQDWIELNTNGSYSKPIDFSSLTDNTINSGGNTISSWNYHIFLCNLLLFYIVYKFLV